MIGSVGTRTIDELGGECRGASPPNDKEASGKINTDING